MRDLPHSSTYEKASLALCLQYPESSGAVLRSTLTPDHFYIAQNRQLFEAIKEHHQDGEMAILNRAMTNAAFAHHGEALFNELTERKISEKKKEEVLEKMGHLLACRRIIEMSPEVVESAYGGDLSTARSTVSGLLDSVAKAANGGAATMTLADCVVDFVSDFEKMLTTGLPTSLPMGLPKLDALTGGLVKDFIIISGPTSSGKSALMNEYIYANSLDHGRRSVLFTYEMNRREVTYRFISRMTGIPIGKLLGQTADGEKPKFRKDELLAVKNASLRLKETGSLIVIEDDVTRDVDGICDKCLEIQAVHGKIDLIAVDYIQIIPVSKGSSKENRETQVSNQGKKLKLLQMQLDCTMIGLSQMAQNFTVRESKALEMHANNVYRVIRGEDPGTGQRIEDEKIVVWKLRNGERFKEISVWFDGSRLKFNEK